MQIIITGTSRGIGREIAKEFIDLGHNVIGLDRNGGTLTHKCYRHYQCDLSQLYNLPEIRLETLRVLINNAGTDNHFNALQNNLKPTIFCTEKYGMSPGIRAIINLGSFCTYTGFESGEYCAAKGGVLAYTRHTAHRVAKYGGTCNCLSPGGVETISQEHITQNPVKYEEAKNLTLLGKWVEESEIAHWCAFLALYNRSMTGQDIVIDNGENINTHFIR